MQTFLVEKQREIQELCRKHHVRQMTAFGSAVRDDFNPECSDVDLLVDFEDPFYADYIENKLHLQQELAELFGRKVDLMVNKYVRNPYLRRSIYRDAKALYAA